jgi:DHA1 family bicyclomycin/chloramphenicol resistance-like MFS transporter
VPVKPESVSFTLILAYLTGLGPMTIDLFIPSLPSMAAFFAATPATVQLTISVYLAGFSIAQIFHGPVSDRVGRKPMLLGALAVYVVASLLCAAAPSIGILIALRVVQAAAAAAPIILARTMVRDVRSGVAAGQMLSVISSIMGIVPILAPIVGGVLETRFGWRASFLAIAAAGVLGFGLVFLALPETLRERRSEPLSLKSILASFAVVGRHPVFRAEAAIVSLGYGGLIAYVGGASFVVQGEYGLGPVAFAVTFAAGAGAYILGTIAGRKLAPRFGLFRTVGVGAALLAAGGGLVLLGILFLPGTLAGFLAPFMVYMVGIGITLPQGIAAAMTPFPERAGAASSLLGFLHMSAAAVTLSLTTTLFGGSGVVMALTLMATGVAAFLTYRATRGLAHV